MAIPITITCECGRAIQTDLGERVVCECGRAYDTSQVPREKRAAVVAAQAQFRVYMWFGILFIAGAALTGYLVHGMVGLLLAAPCVALFWFRIVQPRVSARQRKALADLPSWTIEAG
jgi:hypothetical protein